MANATSRLDILVAAKNAASGELKQIATDASGLERALSGIGKGLVAGLTVEAARQIAETTFEMARASAQADRLVTSFESLAASAGQSSDELLAAMRNASQGTISNTDLIASANRAMLLGVANSADELASLMEVAAARGKAMGLSTSQAFSDIVTGIGRESKLILDNLGIIVNTEAANESYATSLGKTAAQLSDVERKQALLNAVLQSSTGIVRANEAAGRDAAANFERMDASIQNAKEALGRLFEPAMVVVAQAIADAADSAAAAMNSMSAEAVQQRMDTAVLDQALISLQNDIGQLEQGLRRLEAAGQANSPVYQENAAKLAQLKQEAAQTRAELQSLIPSVQLAAEDFTTVSISADEARIALGLVGDAAETTGAKFVNMGIDAMAAREAFNMIAEANMIIEQAARSSGQLFGAKQGGDAGLARQGDVSNELERQATAWREQGYTQREINDVLLPAYIQNLQEADRALFSNVNHTATLSKEARAAQQAFDDLKGIVEGVLQAALDTGTGVNPDDVLAALGLPREDAINENARRLADIAKNGLMGQDWLGNFAAEVPDIWRMIRTAQNPQEEAAYLLRDFQDGLLTSAIDREKAKAIIRRQIMGDQSMAQMAQEIAQELAAEMGIPLQQALSAAQGTLGVGGAGGAGVGSGLAQSLTDGATAGLEENNGGGVFMDKFAIQIRNSFSLLQAAGRDAAKVWGNEFLAVVGENVPPGLVSVLTQLVTPGVISSIAQQGTQAGAVP